jgi:hypothetical protein
MLNETWMIGAGHRSCSKFNFPVASSTAASQTFIRAPGPARFQKRPAIVTRFVSSNARRSFRVSCLVFRRAAVPRADICIRSLACAADQSPGDTGYVSCPCVQASRNDSSGLRRRAFACCAEAAVPMLPALHSCSCSQRCIAVLHDVASKLLLTIRTAFLVAERRLISRYWHRKDHGNDLRLEKNSAPTAFLCRCTPKIRVPTA